MVDFSNLSLKILKIFCLALVSGVCLFVLHLSYMALVGSDLERHILYNLGINTNQQAFDDYGSSAAGYAEADNSAIKQWIYVCVQARASGAAGSSDSIEKNLVGAERALLMVSNNASNKRRYWDERVKSSFNEWQISTWMTIVIGMATTVFVSLSTTEFGRGDGRSQRVVRTLAVVFPALGTAAAAVVGFYGAQAQWSQSSRSLASLSQLHGQMAIDIWKQQCIHSASDGNEVKLIALLDGWSKRYLDIETLSNTGGGSGSDASGSSAPADGAAPSKNKT